MKIKLLAIALSILACFSMSVFSSINSAAKTNQSTLTSMTANFITESSANQKRCIVTDPTGTPLNVRAVPNGKIVGKLGNDTVVYVDIFSLDAKNQSWSQIKMSRRGKVQGWVLTDFLNCE